MLAHPYVFAWVAPVDVLRRTVSGGMYLISGVGFLITASVYAYVYRRYSLRFRMPVGFHWCLVAIGIAMITLYCVGQALGWHEICESCMGCGSSSWW